MGWEGNRARDVAQREVKEEDVSKERVQGSCLTDEKARE